MLELADCELVVGLAAHGSLGRAAAELGYVQSRVSSRLAMIWQRRAVKGEPSSSQAIAWSANCFRTSSVCTKSDSPAAG